MAIMLDGPTTAQEIHEEVGIAKSTAYDLLHAFHFAHVAHISAWEDDSRGYNIIPVFSLGQGRDARKRPRKKTTERAAAYRQRVRAREKIAAMTGVSP